MMLSYMPGLDDRELIDSPKEDKAKKNKTKKTLAVSLIGIRRGKGEMEDEEDEEGKMKVVPHYTQSSTSQA